MREDHDGKGKSPDLKSLKNPYRRLFTRTPTLEELAYRARERQKAAAQGAESGEGGTDTPQQDPAEK